MSVDFALELLKKSKAEGLNTAMETSGFASSEQYLKVLPYVDEFLWDYKETDQKKHQEFTGVAKDQRIGRMQQKEYEVPYVRMREMWEETIEIMGGRI